MTRENTSKASTIDSDAATYRRACQRDLLWDREFEAAVADEVIDPGDVREFLATARR